MVVGVLEILLDQIVVHILSRKLGPNAVDVHGFKLEHYHGTGRILGEGLIEDETPIDGGEHHG